MAVKFEKVEELTEEQKQKINAFVSTYVKEFEEPPFVRDITKDLNPEADGRSYLGKVVSDYLDEIGIQYRTIDENCKAIELNADQQEYILDNMSIMKPMEMAKHLFGTDIKSPFDAKAKAVIAFIDLIKSKEVQIVSKEGEYLPPATLKETMKRVNRAFDETIYKEKELTEKDKRCLAALRMYLKSPRFARTWKNYTIEDQKQAFEITFMRSTHDKEDITETELNLYIDICTDQTDLNSIRRQKSLLDEKLENVDDDNNGKISVALVEAINALAKREDECRKRIQAISKVLDGTRSERLKNQRQGSATIASVIEAWRDEDKRRDILKVAEKNKKLLGDEIERLDNLDDIIGSILGISKEELLDG